MFTPTPKAIRKRKRFLENEAAAKDSRFWIGKIKTAERVGFRDGVILRPINQQAHRQKSSKSHIDVVRVNGQRSSQSHTNLYVVRFAQLGGGEVFLKIGITKNDIHERFAADARQYQTDLICKIGGLRRDEALKLEASLHKLFDPVRYIPTIQLMSGGNSECFTYSTGLEDSMKLLLNSWLSSVGRALVS